MKFKIKCAKYFGILKNYISTSSGDFTSNLQTLNIISGNWWDEDGEFKPLHSLNNIRVPFIRDKLIINNLKSNIFKPLNGYNILDVGCGGGILSEPLANIGANVTGIDTKENINIAIHHSFNYLPDIKSRLNYISTIVEEHCEQKPNYYDACIASEVLEHVDNYESFVKSCCQTVKPNGKIFVTTINKTRLSKFFVINVAENIMGIVTKGTHHWQKFIHPFHLIRTLEK
ncbi:ubiquinone biosynthesis O-methyltransferase, mitochondrial-like isoform X2 [Gordionus sp. m RMFG-2023]